MAVSCSATNHPRSCSLTQAIMADEGTLMVLESVDSGGTFPAVFGAQGCSWLHYRLAKLPMSELRYLTGRLAHESRIKKRVRPSGPTQNETRPATPFLCARHAFGLE